MVEAVNEVRVSPCMKCTARPITELRRTTGGDGSMGHFLAPDDETPAHPFGRTLAGTFAPRIKC